MADGVADEVTDAELLEWGFKSRDEWKRFEDEVAGDFRPITLGEYFFGRIGYEGPSEAQNVEYSNNN